MIIVFVMILFVMKCILHLIFFTEYRMAYSKIRFSIGRNDRTVSIGHVFQISNGFL